MDGLSSKQIQQLARYLLDEYGPDLTGQRLTDCALLVLENIAGYEMADSKETNLILNQIREQYYDLINESNSNSQA